MKQTVEIEVPDGKQAVWKDGKVVFEDIESQLPKTWQEYCDRTMIDENEVVIFDGYLDRPTVIQKGFIREPRDSFKHKMLLPSEEVARQFVALMQLYRLRDCYRQGWEPDWNNQKTIKVCIVQRFPGRYIIEPRDGFYPAFLSFKDNKTAKEFLKNFEDLIKQAGDLI